LWLGGGLTLVTAALLLLQAGWVAGNERARAKVAEQFQTVRWYMPHGRHEVRTFYAASMTAGICEEILYRGYLIWYLAQLTSLWVAVPASSVLFGMAHLYLGKAAALRAGLVGLLLAGLYLFTGSLWAPIVLHAAFDLGSARMAAVVPENLIRPVPSAK
jgi:membrane protease YdiL (CAAX protease family)